MLSAKLFVSFTLPRLLEDFIIFFRETSEWGEEGLVKKFIMSFSEIINV